MSTRYNCRIEFASDKESSLCRKTRNHLSCQVKITECHIPFIWLGKGKESNETWRIWTFRYSDSSINKLHHATLVTKTCVSTDFFFPFRIYNKLEISLKVINTPAPRSYSLRHSMFCFQFLNNMPLPWQHTFCHCPKMCPTHLHFKANMCAKFNLIMLFPLNCWHMSLPWQHIFPHS